MNIGRAIFDLVSQLDKINFNWKEPNVTTFSKGNLKSTFDLAKKFKMRGLPTTILIDKNGNEFARIIGEIDFDTKDFKKIIKKNS